jgi:hypothetical protein
VALAANPPYLPPLSAKAVPGTQPGAARRKPAGKVPAWALKLGTLFTTFSIFAGSFSYATAHLYATDAPLQPATVAASGTPAATGSTSTSASQTSSTTLTSSVRTTRQTAVTTTRHS